MLLTEKRKQPQSIVQFNKYLTDQYFKNIENRDSLYDKAQNIIQDREDYDNYLKELVAAPPYRFLPLDSAKCFYKIYQDRKRVIQNSTDQNVKALKADLDLTTAIYIPLDTFLQKVAIHYVNEIDFTNPNTWKDKGYLIYPVHYGKNGYMKGATSVNKNMSSVVLQFARKSSAPNTWEIIPFSTYNFGDLKPPKKFSGDTLNEIVPGGLSCQ